MTEVLQQAIIVMLEKIENLNKDNKGIQLYIHKFKNLNGPLLKKKKKKKKNTVTIHPKLVLAQMISLKNYAKHLNKN